MLKVGTTSTFVAVFLGLAVFVSSHTSGAEKNCECDFSEAPWEAYGTKAACTTWTRESRRSCEIAFGGLGAEPDLVAQVLGRDPKEYLDDVYTTIQSYFAALQANDTKTLMSPEFVQHVLPIFMRGAFLREPVNLSDAANLNSLIEQFVQTSGNDIGEVFRGDAGSFNRSIDGTQFTVGKGWIAVEYNDTMLITIYMPESE